MSRRALGGAGGISGAIAPRMKTNLLRTGMVVLSAVAVASIGCAAEPESGPTESAASAVSNACQVDPNCRAAKANEHRLITVAPDGKKLCAVFDKTRGGVKLQTCNVDPYAASHEEIWKLGDNGVITHVDGGNLGVTIGNQGGSVGLYASGTQWTRAQDGSLRTQSGPRASFCLTLDVSSRGDATFDVISTSTGNFAPCARLDFQKAVQVYGVKNRLALGTEGDACGPQNAGGKCGQFLYCALTTSSGRHSGYYCAPVKRAGETCIGEAGECGSGACRSDTAAECAAACPDPFVVGNNVCVMNCENADFRAAMTTCHAQP